MLTSGLFKSFVKQFLKFNKLHNNLNSHRSDARRMHSKNKTKSFLSISRVTKIVTIVATLCSFKITKLFSPMKAKKSPSDFIKLLLFWSTLKTFDIKQDSPMTEEKEITICT